MKALPWIGGLVAVVGLALILRSLFPKTVAVASPPRIVTVHDTVARLTDTVWVQKLLHDTVRPPPLPPERITITKIDTLWKLPPLTGALAVSVGPKVGDSTLIQGFRVDPFDSAYGFRRWQVQLYTTGPLKSLVTLPADPFVRATFADPPKPPCGFGCAAKKYLLGGAVGAGACAVAGGLK